MVKWFKRLCLFFIMSSFFAIGTISTLLVWLWLQGAPSIQLDENMVVYSQDRTILAEQHGLESRYAVDLDAISPHVTDALIAAEDQQFYDHVGFNPKRIVGAAYQNILSGEKSQGASTITQQLARNLFLTHDKTWHRKIEELLIAVRLEMFWDKDEILTSYLNTIYFGHGQYGIEAASRYYFDKPASDLSLGEGALLAAVPKGPSLYSPIHNEERATERQHWILQQMEDSQFIDDQQLAVALDEPINLVRPATSDSTLGQYAVDYAIQQATSTLNITPEQLTTAGYQVYTTVNEESQRLLEEAADQHLPDNEEYQLGAMTLDHSTGAIVAIQGGRDFDQSTYNRAIQAERMTGSTFKSFLYYAALVYGFTPSTTLESTETSFTLENDETYDPSNVSDVYANRPVTLTQALAVSDNIYAVKTNQFVKPNNLAEAASLFGIESDVDPGLAMALGTESASVSEMARAYSLLANQGKAVDPYMIEKIEDSDGEVIYEHEPSQAEPVLDERYTFVLTHLLTGMFDNRLNDYLTVTGAPISHQLNHAYAGKSGTTDFDAWMIGYSPHYTTAIWTGYDDNQLLETRVETQAAKQIWGDYMNGLHEELPPQPFTVPNGVTSVEVDPITGKLAGDACNDRARLTYYIGGTEPKTYCEEIQY